MFALKPKSKFDNLKARFSPALQQTALLFIIDMLTNVTDYGFHVYLGRALAVGEFAIVQTVNALVLIIVTTCSVLQPTVARFVAERDAAGARGILQRFLRQSVWLGLLAAIGLVIVQRPVAQWLNIPVLAVTFLGGMVIVAFVRPVLAGMLQGQAKFLGFGLTRTGFAFGRFLLAILFITLIGSRATVAIAAYPLGGLISIGVAAWFLGRGVWQSGTAVPNETMRQGYQLSVAAFIAYAAYMGLQNFDLIWVNRVFSAEQAGNYASAVVLRRVLAVLPGAVTVILYPRIVQRVNAGNLPDKLLVQAAALIILPTVAATAVFLVGGEWIITLLFGASYAKAAPLLGWLGIAMIGFGVATVWLNLFLATRPWGFVACLVVLAVGQYLLLALIAPTTLKQVAQIFAAGGWGSAVGGGLLYAFWLRREIQERVLN